MFVLFILILFKTNLSGSCPMSAPPGRITVPSWPGPSARTHSLGSEEQSGPPNDCTDPSFGLYDNFSPATPSTPSEGGKESSNLPPPPPDRNLSSKGNQLPVSVCVCVCTVFNTLEH